MRAEQEARTDALGKPLHGYDRRDDPIEIIVVHRNTVAPTLEGVRTFFRYEMGWRLFPYAIWVDDFNGETWAWQQLAGFDVMTPHAGKKGWNEEGFSVGINADFRSREPTAEQYDVIVHAVGSAIAGAIAFNAHLGRPDIVPRIEPHHNTCPGAAFPIDQLRRDATRGVAGSDQVKLLHF